jgi:hypothetical protein
MPDYGTLHVARVTRLDVESGNYVLENVPLARESSWGPVPSCVPGLDPGDKVIVGNKGVSRDDLIILAKVDAAFPDIADIPGLVAALAGKADDADVTALQGRATALEGRATVLEGRATTVEGRATVLEGRATTLEGRATTVEGRATSLEGRATAVEGRATVLEAKVGYVIPIGSVGARPSSGLYDGFPIFRTDKGFQEFYDLAATKWRVRGSVTVAALADITDPLTGQMAMLTTDLMWYRWTGSAWLGIQHTSGTEGFARYWHSATQSIPANVNTKMLFSQNGTTTSDVTRAGNNTLTLVRPGVWNIEAGVAWNAGPELAFRNLRLSDSTGASVYDEQGERSVDSNHSVSAVRRFAANDTISVYLYHEHSTAVSTSPSGTERCHVSATWLRP